MRGDEEETEEMMNDGASGRSEEVKDEETARGGRWQLWQRPTSAPPSTSGNKFKCDDGGVKS